MKHSSAVFLFLIGLIPVSSAGQLRFVSCSLYARNTRRDTCDSFAETWDLDVGFFRRLNPGVQCPELVQDQKYCVEGSTDFAFKNATTTSLGASPTASTSSCHRGHVVSADEQCQAIADRYNITLSDVHAWNPSLGGECTLQPGLEICVQALRAVPLLPTPPPPSHTSVSHPTHAATTTTPTTIATPHPLHPGLVPYCTRFHLVTPSDSCTSIIRLHHILPVDFHTWNPFLGSDCDTTLRVGSHVCIRALPAFTLGAYYARDCTGNLHNADLVRMRHPGVCIYTDCTVGSLGTVATGACPHGHVQLSYWGGRDCDGNLYGYEYMDRGACRDLGSRAYRVRSVFLKCAPQGDDCVSNGTCVVREEPVGAC